MLESASCLIGHAPSLRELADEGEAGPLALLLDAMDGVRGLRRLAPPGGRRRPGRPRPRDRRPRRLLPPRPGGPAHRPRRGLGRPGLPRLARHRPGRRQEAHRLPAPPLRARRQPGRRPPRPLRLRPRRPLDLRQPPRAADATARGLTRTPPPTGRLIDGPRQPGIHLHQCNRCGAGGTDAPPQGLLADRSMAQAIFRDLCGLSSRSIDSNCVVRTAPLRVGFDCGRLKLAGPLATLWRSSWCPGPNGNPGDPRPAGCHSCSWP